MDHTAKADPTEGRANNFDALRLALAVLVVFSHSYPLLWGDDAREPLARLTGGQVTGGGVAVSGFFLLSGFLIARSWERSAGLADYLGRRALRIYPGFLVAVAVSALAVGPLTAADPAAYRRAFDVGRFVRDALNLDGVAAPPMFAGNPSAAANGSLWSIRFEFVCYLGVAALGLAGALRRRWPVALAFLAWWALYALQVLFGVRVPGGRLSPWIGYTEFWPRLASCFLAGCLFYLYRDRVAYTRRLFAASAAGLALLGALPGLRLLPLAVPVLGGYAFFHLGFLAVPRLRGFARRGDLSYGTYLYGFPVQQLVIHAWGPGLHPLGLFLLATPPTLAAAALSWALVERPCLALRRPRGAAAAPAGAQRGAG